MRKRGRDLRPFPSLAVEMSLQRGMNVSSVPRLIVSLLFALSGILLPLAVLVASYLKLVPHKRFLLLSVFSLAGGFYCFFTWEVLNFAKSTSQCAKFASLLYPFAAMAFASVGLVRAPKRRWLALLFLLAAGYTLYLTLNEILAANTICM
jgi:hypothetical protein